MITQKTKSLKKLNRKEKYLEKKELLISAGLHVTFNKEQLTTFFDSPYIKNSGGDNSQELWN